MTDTTIQVPDYVLMVKPEPAKTAGELAQVASDLLADMPQPNTLTIYRYSQTISLGFGRDSQAVEAMAKFGARAGEPITGEQTTLDGQPAIRCELEFSHRGVHVEAYAYVKANPATTT